MWSTNKALTSRVITTLSHLKLYFQTKPQTQIQTQTLSITIIGTFAHFDSKIILSRSRAEAAKAIGFAWSGASSGMLESCCCCCWWCCGGGGL